MTRIRSDLLKESQSQSFMCLNLLPYRLQTSSSDRPVSAHNVITLKVKSEDGNHTFILKMCFSETIGHLRQYLDKHRWDHTLLLWQSVFLSLQDVTMAACISCVTERAVSLVMTSSARTHSAATMMTARRCNHVDSRVTLLCCCERGNTLKHWLRSDK